MQCAKRMCAYNFGFHSKVSLALRDPIIINYGPPTTTMTATAQKLPMGESIWKLCSSPSDRDDTISGMGLYSHKAASNVNAICKKWRLVYILVS